MKADKTKLNKAVVLEFLRESNAIERVYDDVSLKQAKKAWDFLVFVPELTVRTLLTLHQTLMEKQDLFPNEIGFFRTVPVYIGGREAMNSLKIVDNIEQWVLNANDLIQNGKNENPIFLERMVKEHHVKYEHIHPFIDGNGRTGRMLMNWERVHLGMDLLVIHEGEEQMDYYKWFKELS